MKTNLFFGVKKAARICVASISDKMNESTVHEIPYCKNIYTKTNSGPRPHARPGEGLDKSKKKTIIKCRKK